MKELGIEEDYKDIDLGKLESKKFAGNLTREVLAQTIMHARKKKVNQHGNVVKQFR